MTYTETHEPSVARVIEIGRTPRSHRYLVLFEWPERTTSRNVPLNRYCPHEHGTVATAAKCAERLHPGVEIEVEPFS